MVITDAQIVAGASAVVLGLTSAIGILWRSFLSKNKQTEEKLSHCETQHDESAKQVLTLTEDVGELRGQLTGIKQMSESVLQEIRNLSSP